MSDNYTREDFNDEMSDLELGLQKEQACLEFYEQSLEQVSDPKVRALYQWFVDATRARVPALQAVRAAAAGSLSWASDVKDQIRSADEQAGGAPPFNGGAEGTPGRAEIISVRQAIELEKVTASVYHTAVRRSRDKNVRALWRYLAVSEEAHKALLDTCFDGLMQLAMKTKRKR